MREWWIPWRKWVLPEKRSILMVSLWRNPSNEKMDRARCSGSWLKPDKPTVLIMAGSFGVSNILRIYNNIIKVNLDFQIIVITGKNERLYVGV